MNRVVVLPQQGGLMRQETFIKKLVDVEGIVEEQEWWERFKAAPSLENCTQESVYVFPGPEMRLLVGDMEGNLLFYRPGHPYPQQIEGNLGLVSCIAVDDQEVYVCNDAGHCRVFAFDQHFNPGVCVHDYQLVGNITCACLIEMAGKKRLCVGTSMRRLVVYSIEEGDCKEYKSHEFEWQINSLAAIHTSRDEVHLGIGFTGGGYGVMKEWSKVAHFQLPRALKQGPTLLVSLPGYIVTVDLEGDIYYYEEDTYECHIRCKVEDQIFAAVLYQDRYVVCCSWIGKIYIIEETAVVGVYDLNESVCGFRLAKYMVEGKEEDVMVAITLNDFIYVVRFDDVVVPYALHALESLQQTLGQKLTSKEVEQRLYDYPLLEG